MDDRTVEERREQARRRAGAFTPRVAGFLMVLVVALLAMFAVRLLPRRTVEFDPCRHLAAGEPAVMPAALPGGKPRTRGLAYMVAPAGIAGTSGSIRDQLRAGGMLRAYSEPPDRVVFSPDGVAHYLPVSPMPGTPRVPGSVSRGNRNQKRVALTFDDGYSGMGALVDLLVELRVPATLFPAGAACAADRESVVKAKRYGLEIANHSWNHPQFTRLTDEGIVRELTSADVKVREICGKGTVGYFRPPYGDCDERVTRVAGALGYLVVQWNHDTLDWSSATTPGQLVARAVDGVQNGDIILMHSHGRYTQEVLPEIVRRLRGEGFELTTVSGVLAP